MHLSFGQWRFKPSLIPSLATLLLFPVFISLGLWQLDRAEQKRAIQSEFEQRLNAPYAPLDLSNTEPAQMRYRRAAYHGYYDPKHQFMHDNRIHKGFAGYHVLTPFKLQGFDKAVLVNRGWVELGESRAVLPAVPVSGQVRQIKGIITLPVSGAFTLGEAQQNAEGWPRLLQQIDIDAMAKALDYPLLPYIIWLAEDQEDGFVRDWRPIYSDPEKSTAYAVQWFSFAAILVFLFIVLNTRRIGKSQESP